MKIFIYGDSNTWGYIPTLKPYTGNDATQPRYEQNQMWWNCLSEGNELFVNGNSGRTTAYDHPLFAGKNAAKTIEEDIKEIDHIDCLIIMLGTNDLKKRYGVSTKEVTEKIHHLIQIMKSKWNCKVFIISPPLVIQGTPITDANYEDAENRVREFKKNLEELALQNGYGFTSFEPCEIGVDGEHLTIDGHKKAAAIIQEAFNDFIKK